MPEPAMDAVLARLDSLEKQNRLFRRIGGGVLLLGLALGGMAMAQEEKVPEVVRARRFEVIDGAGRDRGGLGMKDDTPALVLKSANGVPSMDISLRPVVGSEEAGGPVQPAELRLHSSQGGYVALSGGDFPTLVMGASRRRISGTSASEIPPFMTIGWSSEGACEFRMGGPRPPETGTPPEVEPGLLLSFPGKSSRESPRVEVTGWDGKTLFKVPE